MNSFQNIRHHSRMLGEVTGVLFFKRKLQDWIRQEIVDDDPCDEETFFSVPNQLDQEETPQLNLLRDLTWSHELMTKLD